MVLLFAAVSQLFCGYCATLIKLRHEADGFQAAIHLGKLSKETYEAIDEIPVRIKTAQFLMRTYECTKIEEHAAHLYQAIIEALQHILTWYKRKAGS